jgi:N-acetylmuramoyl-L-alanine amidase
MGFVNNPEDEARLRDPKARATLMRAVARSIDLHFDEPVRVAAR